MMARLTPSAASLKEIARPCPVPPPVTMAVLPRSSMRPPFSHPAGGLSPSPSSTAAGRSVPWTELDGDGASLSGHDHGSGHAASTSGPLGLLERFVDLVQRETRPDELFK